MNYFRFLSLTFLFLFLFSCSSRKEQTAHLKMRQLEYRRHAKDPAFLHYLNSKNDKIRLEAVATLGRIQDSSMVIPLSNRLSDENPAIRAEAAFAIGQIKNRNSERVLLDQIDVETDDRVKAKIIEALGKRGTERSFSTIRDYSISKNRQLQEQAEIADAMLAYREFPPFNNVAPLINILKDDQNPEVRWRAAYALFRIQNPRTFEAEFHFLSDPHPYVRYFLLKGLQTQLQNYHNPAMKDLRQNPVFEKIHQRSVSQPFRARLTKLLQDSTWYVRIAAAETVAELPEYSFFRGLTALLKDPIPYVRFAAISALSSKRGKKIVETLKSVVLSASDWRLRGTAINALAKLSPGTALPLIKKYLDQAPWPENYYLIRALKAIPQKEAGLLLKNLAVSPVPAQNSNALEALVNRKNPPIDFLLSRLSEPDPAAVTIISSFLAYRKDPRALKPLLNIYPQFKAPRDMETIQAVLAAIDSLRNPASVSFFREQLQNPFPPVRQMAANALRRMNVVLKEAPAPVSKDLTRWDFPEIDPDSRPRVQIKTSKGAFIIECYPKKAPVNVANFIYLVQKKYFDGLYFHRVVPGFVVQGGDPRGDGWGGPGYSIPCEYNDIPYLRGTVGMALAGKDTGGSQFFVTQLPQPHLNGRYTVFGKVISGMEVVDRLLIYDKIETATLLK